MFYLLISLYVFPLSEYYLQKNDKDTIYYLYFLYFKSCQSSISVKKHKVKKCFLFLVSCFGKRQVATCHFKICFIKKPPQKMERFRYSKIVNC